MKKIEAILKPFKLDGVKDALAEAGIQGITVSEVRGVDRQQAHKGRFRGTEYPVDLLPEIKIELILPNDRLKTAVAAIVKGSKSSEAGHEHVFVSNIEDALQPE